MHHILTTAAAVVTFVVGACLVGNWPQKPHERHPETPEVAPRPRRGGRVHPIAPRRYSSGSSRSRSRTPDRHRYHRSRLPKHVTYMTIIALFAFATRTQAVAFDKGDNAAKFAHVTIFTSAPLPGLTYQSDQCDDHNIVSVDLGISSIAKNTWSATSSMPSAISNSGDYILFSGHRGRSLV